MIVVSNTSPILALYRIGQVSLIRDLFQTIVVPSAVELELARRMVSVRSLPWVEVSSAPLVELRPNLDLGEAEAIALASRRRADVLLIDEKLGRSEAKSLGIPVLGTLGLLLIAKQQGLVPSVTSLVEALQAQSAFWIAPSLRRKVLEEAGES